MVHVGCPTEQILTAVGCDGSAVGVLLAAGMLASLPGEGSWGWAVVEALGAPECGVFGEKRGAETSSR